MEGTSAPAGAETPDDLAALLARVARRVRRAHIRALEPLGVSPQAARALSTIERLGAHGEVRPSGLAAALDITPRSATEIVDALEERDLVRRSPSPTDRRAVALVLTDQGRRLRQRTRRLRGEATREITARLTESEQAELTRLLTKALASDERP